MCQRERDEGCVRGKVMTDMSKEKLRDVSEGKGWGVCQIERDQRYVKGKDERCVRGKDDGCVRGKGMRDVSEGKGWGICQRLKGWGMSLEMGLVGQQN